MSDIDTCKHLRLGLFLGIPLYEILQDTDALHSVNNQDHLNLPKHHEKAFVAKGSLALGGGSGEHPALIFHNPTYCVARYLIDILPTDSANSDHELVAKSCCIQEDLQTLEYCKWTHMDHIRFHDQCRHLYLSYGIEPEYSFEAWLMMIVGAFLFHVNPSYNATIQSWRDKFPNTPVCFNLIAIPYERYSGMGHNKFKIALETIPTE